MCSRLFGANLASASQLLPVVRARGKARPALHERFKSSWCTTAVTHIPVELGGDPDVHGAGAIGEGFVERRRRKQSRHSQQKKAVQRRLRQRKPTELLPGAGVLSTTRTCFFCYGRWSRPAIKPPPSTVLRAGAGTCPDLRRLTDLDLLDVAVRVQIEVDVAVVVRVVDSLRVPGAGPGR